MDLDYLQKHMKHKWLNFLQRVYHRSKHPVRLNYYMVLINLNLQECKSSFTIINLVLGIVKLDLHRNGTFDLP